MQWVDISDLKSDKVQVRILLGALERNSISRPTMSASSSLAVPLIHRLVAQREQRHPSGVGVGAVPTQPTMPQCNGQG
jgi:hypothetical protein